MLNPLEYDLEELREVAGVEVAVDGGDEGATGFGRPLPDADLVAWARQYRELAARDGELDGEALPLEAVPTDAGSALLVLEWLDYLVHRAGVHGALAALDYYGDVGWLAGSAERELRDYLRGLDTRASGAGGLDALDARDHRQSLLFATRLADGRGLPEPERV